MTASCGTSQGNFTQNGIPCERINRTNLVFTSKPVDNVISCCRHFHGASFTVEGPARNVMDRVFFLPFYGPSAKKEKNEDP